MNSTGRVVAEGVAHPDAQGVSWHEEFPREVVIAAERDMAEAAASDVYRSASLSKAGTVTT